MVDSTNINTNTSTTIADLPVWMQQYSQGLLGRAATASQEGYQPYQGARIADQTAPQLAANAAVTAQQGAWQPGMTFAGQTANDQVGNYMNPYTNQVVDRIAQLGQRNLTDNLMPQVNSTFTGAGQFGSTRNADFMNRALRDTNESVLGQQANTLNTGYQQSVQNFQNDAARAANVANMATQLGYQDTGMLSQVGKEQQSQNQQGLDVAFQNYQTQQQFPKEQLSWLNSVVHGLPASTGAPITQLPYNSPTSPLQAAAAAFSGTKSAIAGPSPVQQTGQQVSAATRAS